MAKFSVCRIYKVTLWLNFCYNYSVNLLQISHLYIHPEVKESWPYLSNATPWHYELSHVRNEFSLVGLTACQYENG